MEETKSSTPVLEREASPGGPPPFVPPATPTSRLYRSRTDRIVGGVAGGLGHYLNLDPVWIRLAFVVLAMGGAGVLAYLVLWIVIPKNPITEPEPPITASVESDRVKQVLAWGLVAFGIVMVATNLQFIPSLVWSQFWPALLIVAGAAILLRLLDTSM